MTILDSNLIIYSALPEYAYLRPLMMDSQNYTSIFSKIEVLGFHRLDEKSKRYFEGVFYSLETLAITDEIFENAIRLRQQRKCLREMPLSHPPPYIIILLYTPET